MSKPIIVIYAPEKVTPPADHERIRAGVSALTRDEYYVLVVPTGKGEFRFEAFYDKDFNEATYLEIQEKIKREFK